MTVATGGRRRLLAGLIGIYTTFGVVVTSIAPMLEEVRADLGMSRTAMGLALGAWALVFIATAPVAGRFIDRVGLTVALTLGGLSIAVSALARSLATGSLTLWLAVALFGLGGPLVSAGAPTLVRAWFPEGRQRRLAVSSYAVAPSLGSVVALAATNSVLLPLLGSWRLVLVAEGALALVATGAWVVLARSVGTTRPAATPVPIMAGPASVADDLDEVPAPAPPSNPTAAPVADGLDGAVDPDPVAAPSTVRALVGSSAVRWSLVLAFGMFFLNHGVNTWFPTILVDLTSLSAARSSNLVAVATVAGMVAALVAPSLIPAHSRGRGLAAVCLVVAAALPLVLLGGRAAVAAAILVGVRGALVPIGALLLMESPAVTDRNAGLANGLWFSAGEVGGVTGPLFVGIVADSGFGFEGAVVALAGVAGALVLLAPRADRRSDDALHRTSTVGSL